MNTILTNLATALKAKGMTAKSFNSLVKTKLDTSLHGSVDASLKEVVQISGFAASGGLAHALAMVECLIEAGAVDGEDADAVKHAFWVLVATENASAWAQRAGLRVDAADESAESLAKEFA